MASLTLINTKLSYTAAKNTNYFRVHSYNEIEKTYPRRDASLSKTIRDESFSDGFWVPMGVWDNLDLSKTDGTVSGTLRLRNKHTGNFSNYNFSMPGTVRVIKGSTRGHSCGSGCRIDGAFLYLSVSFNILETLDSINASHGNNLRTDEFKFVNYINFDITLDCMYYWSSTITEAVSKAHTVNRSYEDVDNIVDKSGYKVYMWDDSYPKWVLWHYYKTLSEAETLRDTLEDAGNKVRITRIDTNGNEVEIVYETLSNKIIVTVKNTGYAGYFTVGVSTTSNLMGSGCNLSGNVLEDLPTQYIYLNSGEIRELTFNLANSYTGLVYAIAKIYLGNSTQQEDCLDGGYGNHNF